MGIYGKENVGINLDKDVIPKVSDVNITVDAAKEGGLSATIKILIGVGVIAVAAAIALLIFCLVRSS